MFADDISIVMEPVAETTDILDNTAHVMQASG